MIIAEEYEGMPITVKDLARHCAPGVTVAASDDPADTVKVNYDFDALTNDEWEGLRKRAATPDELPAIAVEIHARCLLEWDVTDKGQPVPITPEVLRIIPFNTLALFFHCAVQAARSSALMPIENRMFTLRRIAALMARAVATA